MKKRNKARGPLAALITRVIDTLYIPPVRRIMPLETFRYGVCGVLNYVVLDPLLYYIAFHYIFDESTLDLGFYAISGHIAALILVFPITFFNGFWLNKHIAFRRSPLRGSTQLMRYALAVCGSLLLNYGCMKLFVDALGLFPTPSKLLSTGVTTVYSYLAQKYFTFRR